MKQIRLMMCSFIIGVFAFTQSMAQIPDSLFIVGSATPIGWSIDKAIALTKNTSDTTQFFYDGILVPGTFKFPVNRNTDWGQDMYMRNTSDSAKWYLHIGGASDDNQWTIYKKGWYHLVINLKDSTISYSPLQLYIVGDATPIGWNIGSAIQLTENSDSLFLFTYIGKLIGGSFKFPVNRNTDWGQNMYMCDPNDSTKIYLHIGGASDDNKWTIASADSGYYTITLNVKALTIEIIKQTTPITDSLFIVGSATPIGWSIDKAIALVKNPDDTTQFIYDGALVPGSFKFPVNKHTDWGQNMYMRDTTDSTKIYLHIGGASDDKQWNVYKAGWYHLVIDLVNLTISYTPLELYIVGDATPIGWDISTAIQLKESENNDSLFIFTYTGKLIKGDFKFAVNRNTDWGQNMYMRDPNDSTKIYLHIGGASDDNKWHIYETDSMNYSIILNVKDLTISISKVITGIKQIELAQNVIYPSITNDMLYTNLINIESYSVIDLTGRIVMDGNLKNNSILVSNLPNSMYIIRLVDSNKQVYIQKFIKR